MDFTTFLWTTFAAFLTLATFSFLYKDNPFYKIAEHIVTGVAAGYFAILLWHNGLIPKLVFERLEDGDEIQFAETGALAVGIVGVKMGQL